MGTKRRRSASSESAAALDEAPVAPVPRGVVEKRPLKKKTKRKQLDKSIGSDAGMPDALLATDIAGMIKNLAGEASALGESWGDEEAASSTQVSRKKAAVAEADESKKAAKKAAKKARKKARPPKRVRDSQKESAQLSEVASEAEHKDSAEPKDVKKAPREREGHQVAARASKTAPGEKVKDVATEKKHHDLLKVWLGDLPWSVDEAKLRQDFGKFGTIEKLYYPRDEKGRSTGVARLFYKKEGDVENVFKLDGIEYGGREIKVRTRSPRQRSGKSWQRQARHESTADRVSAS